ncbi:TIGR00296 family protein [Thermoproteota archaeon]
MFSLKQGRKLVELARLAIETSLSKKSIDFSDYEEFSEKQGVFVTLNTHGELRGCIGFTEPVYELNRAIVEAARSAAFTDPRFPSVTKEELDEIEIEVSALTVPKLIEAEPEEYTDKIVIGRDGLIIRGMFGSGLLLPQVATEQNWDEETFLRHTCMKAGLDEEAWKDSSNKLYIFQAQIFSEKSPKGEVVEKEIQ